MQTICGNAKYGIPFSCNLDPPVMFFIAADQPFDGFSPTVRAACSTVSGHSRSRGSM
jgi:hypothetical protein